MCPASSQQILFVHGRGAKPNKEALQSLWIEALTAGIQRDAPDKLAAFQAANIEMVYYADQLTSFAEPGFDESLDLDNRRQALDELRRRTKARDFRRKHYEQLPGKTPLKEFAMDLSATLGMGSVATKKAMPELAHYWQDEGGWASTLQNHLATHLRDMMNTDRNILIISHCMGSVLTWDGLWQLTQDARENGTELNRITRWITLGSPLGARSVQTRLSGRKNPITQRYPVVLNAWHNIAAEDDYVCHDKTVADDYKEMLEQRLIGDIRDHTIYNLSVRYGRSNPHSSMGYLIHPRTVELVTDWLN
jgi:hypothetical protein